MKTTLYTWARFLQHRLWSQGSKARVNLVDLFSRTLLVAFFISAYSGGLAVIHFPGFTLSSVGSAATNIGKHY